jgi:hypothetical protein
MVERRRRVCYFRNSMRRREGDLRQVWVGVRARAPVGKEEILVVSDRGSVPGAAACRHPGRRTKRRRGGGGLP